MIRVSVAMSSYNGEKYIEEQILSILEQNNVHTSLFIRDDGSTDRTTDIIRRLQSEHPNRIQFEIGENLGYKMSFLKALTCTEEADYYAFSDQDDVWMRDKCIQAISRIEKGYVLYASAQILTDERLNEIWIKQFSDVVPTLEGEFTRHRLPGCTYVFNKAIKDMATPYADMVMDSDRIPSHDMVIACLAFSVGKVYIDERAFLKYRRLDSSITPGGQGLKKRIYHELEYLFHNRNRYSYMAASILEKYSNMIDEEKLVFLRCVANYKKSASDRLKLLTNSRMDCGLLPGNLENKIKILLGSY